MPEKSIKDVLNKAFDLGAERPTNIRNLDDAISEIKEILKEKIKFMDTWNCDNPNCGKGAICNFCALRIEILKIIGEIK